MKTKEVKELHQKTIVELIKLGEELRSEINKIKMDLSLAKIKNTNLVKNKKKDLARILTIIKEKSA